MTSRNRWIGLMVLLFVTLAVASPVLAQDLPKSVDVNISTNDGGGEWYKNPIIIGAGILGLFLVVALANRGGTTVVKS